MEKKEAEVEQLKGGNVRSMTESQRGRAVSPFHIPRYGVSTSIKPETPQRRGDDNRISEVTENMMDIQSSFSGLNFRILLNNEFFTSIYGYIGFRPEALLQVSRGGHSICTDRQGDITEDAYSS